MKTLLPYHNQIYFIHLRDKIKLKVYPTSTNIVLNITP
jgi:hypothetical protein